MLSVVLIGGCKALFASRESSVSPPATAPAGSAGVEGFELLFVRVSFSLKLDILRLKVLDAFPENEPVVSVLRLPESVGVGTSLSTKPVEVFPVMSPPKESANSFEAGTGVLARGAKLVDLARSSGPGLRNDSADCNNTGDCDSWDASGVDLNAESGAADGVEAVDFRLFTGVGVFVLREGLKSFLEGVRGATVSAMANV
ncbi:hypothetical protein F4809DRAFT_625398 [Biscogniauxia mediterranea]|nr:hypothetical protein F4809DRAFT_625398 [Biscogniauxia mediterranea]